MKTILALDTATASLALSVVRTGQGVLATRDRGPGPNHSTLLPGLVGEVLEEAGLKLGELDGIAVGLGPGAFTGLRIALSTAKGLAYGALLPLAGASSLEAMERAARKRTPQAAIAALLDARKGELYARIGGEESVLAPEEAARRIAALPGSVVLLGEGYDLYRAILDAAVGEKRVAVPDLPATPPALELAELCEDRLGAYSREAIFALEPRYLRSTARDLSLGPRPV